MPIKDRERRLASHREYAKGYYATHKDEAREKKRRQRERLAALVREQRQRPCADCHGEFPWYVMEFDHREPATPRRRVPNLIGHGSPARILAEIAKCDVVCANCHCIRTWRRREEQLGRLVEWETRQSEGLLP